MPRIDAVDAFLSKFKVGEGCWLWERALTNHGYGQFTAGQIHYKAHKFSYQLFNGDIPKSRGVLHKCNAPACVRPNHLYAGTQKENMQDSIRSGRFKFPPHPSGQKHPRALLSLKDVRHIRMELTQGKTMVSLAKKYGVDPSTLSRIKRGLNWKNFK